MNPHSIPNDRTIYVSKYAIGTTVEQLTSKFAQFGQVDQVLPNSNLKGMFVVFNSPDAVTKALSKDVDIKGVPLNVSQYLDIEKLDSEANVFIENIDSTVTQQSLKNLLSQYGQILSIKIQVSDRGGVAYIQFDKKQAADACIADQAKLGLKIAKYAHKKGKSHQIVRDQLYISDIKSTGSMEQLRQDLIAHFGEFGPVDSVQVNTNSKSGALYSFVKFQSQEHASKALKSNKAFQNQQLVAEWVVNGNDRDIEANLFTKNIKMSVTEEQLRAAYSQIVPLEDVRIIKSKPNATPKYKNAVATQKASLYLKSAEDGKKVIDQALRNPDVIALYEKGTVLLSPMLPLHELSSFYQMKKNETTMNYAQRFQHGQQYQQGYPQQGYPQQPYPYPQQGYPQQPYPQQGYPQQPHYPRQYRDNNYNNNNNYRPRQPRQPQMPSQQQLQIMLDKGQQKQVNEIVGSLLFPRVTQAVGQVQAPLITGILIDFENYSLGDQFKMLGDANYLNENIRQAGELLQQH